LSLRDRDGIITREGIIFRVFGYSHPKDSFVCDAEYASAKVFSSTDPRAPRTGGDELFYKFYDDEGMKLVFQKFPQYTFFHEMLARKVVGVRKGLICDTKKPEKRLQAILRAEKRDILVDAMRQVLNKILPNTGIATEDLGVFGSMLHGFHHPDFSDIDLIVYGRKENLTMRETLEGLYDDSTSGFENEFANDDAMKGKKWRFKNLSVKELVRHQRRKMIYGLYKDNISERTIKVEFEPVKAWKEISSEYDPKTRIINKGWVRIRARVVDDSDAPFIPSVYEIEPMVVLDGSRDALEAVRVYSYMEEFRQQAQRDEIAVVEGNLEEVLSSTKRFRQITLTYCPRYYEQVLKVEQL
jgi:predicted nucleotidyltransferase